MPGTDPTRRPRRQRGPRATQVGGGIDFVDRAIAAFLWTSAAQAGRPNPFLRIARFTTPQRDLIDEHDVWNSINAIGYGAAEANSLGHVGIVIARCSTSTFPHAAASIVDSYQPWGAAMTFTTMVNGSAGPQQNRWGDYFDVQRHWFD